MHGSKEDRAICFPRRQSREFCDPKPQLPYSETMRPGLNLRVQRSQSIHLSCAIHYQKCHVHACFERWRHGLRKGHVCGSFPSMIHLEISKDWQTATQHLGRKHNPLSVALGSQPGPPTSKEFIPAFSWGQLEFALRKTAVAHQRPTQCHRGFDVSPHFTEAATRMNILPFSPPDFVTDP